MEKRNAVFAYLAIIFAGVLAYSNTFHAAFHFDDTLNIIENTSLQNLLDVKAIWAYWPTRFLSYFSFALNYHWNRWDVFGYHLVNLLIHLSAGVLVYCLVRLLFLTPALEKDPLNPSKNKIAFFSGLVFTLHPLQTQAVTYIVQRSASLAGLFSILCICFYIRSRISDGQKAAFNLYDLGAFFAGLGAMFSKETAACLPLLLLLCDRFFFQGSKRPAHFKTWLLLIALATVIPLTMLATNDVDLIHLHRHAEQFKAVPQPAYFWTQLRVLLTYARLFFLPIHQNLDYDYPILTNFLDPRVWISALLLLGILLAALKLFRNYRLMSFGLFWIFCALLPESSLIPIADVIFEHRLYLPMPGFALFFVSAWFYFFKKRSARAAVVILSIVVCAYTYLTYQRNAVWKDEISLWSDVIEKSPQKIRGYNNRGNEYHRRGELDLAVSDFEKVLEISPDSAQAYNNRASVYLDKGMISKAILGFSKAIKIDPNYAPAYNNRANALCSNGLYEDAIQDYTRCLEIKPGNAQVLNNRANAYYRKGLYEEAIRDYDKAIALHPGFAEAYSNRAVVYVLKKLYDRAIADSTAALRLQPNLVGAFYNRAVAYLLKEEYSSALKDLDDTIRLNPAYASAYVSRAKVFFKIGQYEKSWDDVRKARELGENPDLNFLNELTEASGKTS